MSKIIDIASYLPKKVLTNDELSERFINWNPEKIFKKTGIKFRHIAQDDQYSSDMAIAAANKLFDKTGFEKNNIDMIFLITQSQDQCIPSTSFKVHKELDLSESCGCFDINHGCTGYIYGLAMARSFISSKQCENILLLTSDTYSKLIDPNDSSLATLFGDGATATLIVADDKIDDGIGKCYFGTNRKKKDLLNCRNLGLKKSINSQNKLFMDGPGILNFTLDKIPKFLLNYLEENNAKIDDYDHIIFHQANKFILEKLYKKINAGSKGLISLENTGNTVSSSIPMVLEELLSRNHKKRKILLGGFGVGLSWGFTNIVL